MSADASAEGNGGRRARASAARMRAKWRERERPTSVTHRHSPSATGARIRRLTQCARDIWRSRRACRRQSAAQAHRETRRLTDDQPPHESKFESHVCTCWPKSAEVGQILAEVWAYVHRPNFDQHRPKLANIGNFSDAGGESRLSVKHNIAGRLFDDAELTGIAEGIFSGRVASNC